MGRQHVAIVGRQVAVHLRSGRKRIETRFTRCRRAPFGCIEPGDTVHFKLSGGAFIGSVRVERVEQLSGLTRADLASLRRRYAGEVCAPAGYWEGRRSARFAVLMWIGRLERGRPARPVPRQYGNAWVVLE